MSDRNCIFISYRRSDAAGSTTALRRTLVDRFHDERVFQDVQDIAPGDPFPDVLKEQLARAAVVVAVIGKGWLSATDEFSQRRIDFPEDWVRKELSAALADPEVTVIPVLVDGAVMPPARALPSALQALAARNAVTIRHDAWDATTKPLMDQIAKKIAPSSEATPVDASLETLTPQSLRQLVMEAVREALEGTNQPDVQVLRATLDQISQLIPGDDSASLTPERKITLERLLRRIVGRPLVQVSNDAEQIFSHQFTTETTDGRWVGYSLDMSRPARWETTYRGCLLLLPDESGNVKGAVVADKFDSDAEFARDDGYETWSHGPLLVEVGSTFGKLRGAA